jgi:Fe-S-cluster containining protein
LCLACGLCCIGVAHSHAALGADELDLAREADLRVDMFEDGLGFHLPCPQYREGKCAAYLCRPRACVSYQCELLERYLDNQVTFEESVSLVTQARRMVDALRAKLPDGDTTPLTFKVLRQVVGGRGTAGESLR